MQKRRNVKEIVPNPRPGFKGKVLPAFIFRTGPVHPQSAPFSRLSILGVAFFHRPPFVHWKLVV